MARDPDEPPRGETPPPLPWYLPPEMFTQQRNRHLTNALPWYLPPEMYIRQRQRHNNPTRTEQIATFDKWTQRNPNASQPVTGQQNNPANLPTLPNVRAQPPATGQGGSLPPTRLQNPMIQAYLKMLMRQR